MEVLSQIYPILTLAILDIFLAIDILVLVMPYGLMEYNLIRVGEETLCMMIRRETGVPEGHCHVSVVAG